MLTAGGRPGQSRRRHETPPPPREGQKGSGPGGTLPSRELEGKTNNTGDSHVVTHRSTNPAITCLYMAERTGCLVLTYLWSFVVEGVRSRDIMVHRPSCWGRTDTKMPGGLRLRDRVSDTCGTWGPRYGARGTKHHIWCHVAAAGATRLLAWERNLPGTRHGTACHRRPPSPYPIRSPLGAGFDPKPFTTNGEVFNKSSGIGLTLSSS
jgi:hypothetical protein